jgi:hypothetical protein
MPFPICFLLLILVYVSVRVIVVVWKATLNNILVISALLGHEYKWNICDQLVQNNSKISYSRFTLDNECSFNLIWTKSVKCVPHIEPAMCDLYVSENYH